MDLQTWLFFFKKNSLKYTELYFKKKHTKTLKKTKPQMLYPYPKCWTATNWKDRTGSEMFMGTKGDHLNGKVMTSLLPLSYRYSPQMGNAGCLTADQSGCAIFDEDPAASVGDSFQKLLLEEQWLLPEGKVSFCHMRRYVPSLKNKSRAWVVFIRLQKHRPLLGTEIQSKLLRMFFKNANEVFWTLLYLCPCYSEAV